jgi:hypothetical protein
LNANLTELVGSAVQPDAFDERHLEHPRFAANNALHGRFVLS